MIGAVVFVLVSANDDPNGFAPNQYLGVALDLPADDIPERLLVEVAQAGRLELWEFQAAFNRMRPFSEALPDVVTPEERLADAWTTILRERCPSLRLVVEIRPFEQMTWYQAVRTAPTEDEKVFVAHETATRLGNQGACEKCGVPNQYSEPTVSSLHRGVRLMRCEACGVELIHSTRTIRNLIEPTEKYELPRVELPPPSQKRKEELRNEMERILAERAKEGRPFIRRPEEILGIVCVGTRESLSIALTREISRLGYLNLWRYQSFHNHNHPFTDGTFEQVQKEIDEAREWANYLGERFPHLPFVVVVEPCGSMSWYQVVNDAPTTDEEVFEAYCSPVSYRISRGPDGTFSKPVQQSYSARTGDVGPCEKCGAENQFTEPETSPIHRGVRIMRCLACNAQLVHSTRTIRIHVEASSAKLV